MSWPVILRPDAEADLRHAMRCYESQRPNLGRELLDAFAKAVGLLEEHPQRHPIYYRGFRRLLTHRFPYIIFRVLHAKRDHRRHLPPLGSS